MTTRFMIPAQNTDPFNVLKLFNNVEKLRLKNYKIWHLRVTTTLYSIGLQEHLTTEADLANADEVM